MSHRGKRDEEQTDLDAEADMVSDRAVIREGDRRRDERDGQAGHVRSGERPTGVPASTMARPSYDRRSARRRQMLERRLHRVLKKPHRNLPTARSAQSRPPRQRTPPPPGSTDFNTFLTSQGANLHWTKGWGP